MRRQWHRLFGHDHSHSSTPSVTEVMVCPEDNEVFDVMYFECSCGNAVSTKVVPHIAELEAEKAK